MKVLCCGDREWKHALRIRQVLLDVLPLTSTIVEGGCRGADLQCRVMGEQLGHTVKEYPAEWKVYGKAAGPIRNRQMLDDNPDIELVLAFHDNISRSRGTADMLRRARARNIKTRLFTSTGEMEW